MIIANSVELAPYTTIGLGGAADYFCTVTSIEELRQCFTWAARQNFPLLVLGGGSNLIIPDNGYRGLVVHLALRGVSIRLGDEFAYVTAAAGESWDDLVARTVKEGLAGLECLSGIPGTVGATPIQNVGAYGQEVAETISDVQCLDRRSLELIRFPGADCGFAYRQSRFKGEDRGRFVVIEVTYRLSRKFVSELRYPELQRAVNEDHGVPDWISLPATLQAIRATVLKLRRRKSMVLDPLDPNTRSVGSFFMNPVVDNLVFENICRIARQRGFIGPIPGYPANHNIKVPAAWLIEQAGFPRGYDFGSVGISTNHSLALVNHSNGTTARLLELASEIRQTVLNVFGIPLQVEPEIL